MGEPTDRLGVIEALDTGIGPIKGRARGVSGGELVAGLAQCQLLGAAPYRQDSRGQR